MTTASLPTTLTEPTTPTGLLGDGIMYTAMDVDPARDEEFNAWYTHEHLQERLSMPGFLRARRYVRSAEPGPGQRYMTIYEAAHPGTFSTPEYLSLLNSPSEWSQRMQPILQRVGRTIMQVRYSVGTAVGRELAAVELSPADPERLVAVLKDRLGPSVLARPEITGFHLTAQDSTATRAKTTTQEAASLGRPDLLTDWLMIVEGTDDVLALTRDLIADPEFREADGETPPEPTGYDYLVSVTPQQTGKN